MTGSLPDCPGSDPEARKKPSMRTHFAAVSVASLCKFSFVTICDSVWPGLNVN